MIQNAPEIIIATATATGILSASAVAVAHPGAEDMIAAVWWSTMPLVGAILASGISFLLGSSTEPRKRVFGRALFALVVGVAGPRITIAMKPEWHDWFVDPILLIVFGGTCGLVGYAASVAVINWFMVRAPEVAESKLNMLFNKQYKHENFEDDKHQPLLHDTSHRVRGDERDGAVSGD